MSTITSVVRQGLCHGCGICAVVCRPNAIEIRSEDPGIFVPFVNEDTCTYCGVCLEICSGKDAFGGNSLLGDVTGVWTGYATDEGIRINGASGGIVSAILIHLLESQAIDAAVICKPDNKFPTRGCSFAAQTRDEIIFGAKSIYGMTEIATGLSEALNNKNVNKIAVVGLPCQIASLKRASELIPKLKSKIILLIGLMDGHNVYHKATEYTIRRQGFRLKHIAEFRYRASGWSPKITELVTNNGQQHKLSWQASPFAAIWDAMLFIPRRCLICNDFTAESADIAVADAWLEEYEGNQKGYSIVLSHTQRGTDMVQNFLDSKYLELEPRDISIIGYSQSSQLDFKKRTFAVRARILGIDRWGDGKSIGNPSVEDYLTEYSNVWKNRIVQIIPAFIWQMSSPNSLISRLERFLFRLLLKLYNKIPHGNNLVWKKQVRFRPSILENIKEQFKSGNS